MFHRSSASYALGAITPTAIVTTLSICAPSSAQTVVTGGDPPTVITARDLETSGTLSFIQGDGSAGFLEVITPGTFTNSWSMTDAVALFNLSGGGLTIASAVPYAGNIATGTCSIGVQAGTLTLGQNSFLTGFTGTFAVTGPGTLVIEQADWFTSATSIELNSNAGTPTLIWGGGAAGSFAGTLNLGVGTATVSSTEDFALTGTVSGTGNLLVTRTAGSTAEIGLGFTAGSFAGTTIVSDTAARLLALNSIGDAGLTLAGGDLVVDGAVGSLTIGAAQDLTVIGVSSITGTGGASALTVDGEMAGNGTLAVTDMAMAVNGTTSTFTGGITLGTGSFLTTANSAWVEGLGALHFDASSTVSYAGAADVTYDGLLRLSTDPSAPNNATFRSVGAGSGDLTLSATVSGSGDIIVETTGGSTAAFTLALGGTFNGTTIVNEADVAINTQSSVGSAGLTLNDVSGIMDRSRTMDVSVGAPLAFGNSQLLTVAGIVNMSGSVTSAAINAQGGLHSADAATLNLDDIDLTVGTGTASTFVGDISLTDGATLTLRGADLGAVDLLSAPGSAEVAFGGIGTIGSIGDLTAFSGRINLGDRGESASSVLNVTGNVSLSAMTIVQSHILASAESGVGTADQMAVGGAFTAGGSTMNLVYDPSVCLCSLIPPNGQTVTYTIISAMGGLNGTFGTINLLTIDPITGLPTTRPFNENGEAFFLGGTSRFIYSPTSFSIEVTGDPVIPAPGALALFGLAQVFRCGRRRGGGDRDDHAHVHA